MRGSSDAARDPRVDTGAMNNELFSALVLTAIPLCLLIIAAYFTLHRR
jgi:hypothetical protein